MNESLYQEAFLYISIAAPLQNFITSNGIFCDWKKNAYKINFIE